MIISNGYIVAVCRSDKDFEIISSMVANKPQDDVDGFVHRLKADTLTWELVELPPIEPTDDDATESDYIDALNDLGVTVDEES